MNLDLNVKSKMITLQNPGVGKLFLNGVQKTLAKMEKINKLDFIKIKKMFIKRLY